MLRLLEERSQRAGTMPGRPPKSGAERGDQRAAPLAGEQAGGGRADGDAVEGVVRARHDQELGVHARRDEPARIGPRRRRKFAAIRGPNLITQQRTDSRLTSIARWASSSSTSRMESVKRKYSHTAYRITSGGNR